MTREEAIAWLKLERKARSEISKGEGILPALDMAIESLQTEQQTEEEMLREQCQAFIDIVNHTEKGENHEID